jgi:hypothetical protein
MRTHRRAALSRVETIIVLALAGTLVGLLLPACQRARDDGAARQTRNNLKQIALSIHSCHDVYKRFPPAWGEFPPQPADSAKTASPRVRGAIHFWLLPFVEGDQVYKRANLPPKGENNDEMGRVWRLALVSEVLPPYVAPSDFTTEDGTVMLDGKVYGVQNLAANIRLFGPLSGDGAQPGVEPSADAFDGRARFTRISDGTSNTIAFATRYAKCGSAGSTWSQIGTATLGSFGGNGAFFGSNISPVLSPDGDNTSGDNTTFQSRPSQGACSTIYAQSLDRKEIHVALADGSVRDLSPTVSIRTWSRAIIPNDGFRLDSDWD